MNTESVLPENFIYNKKDVHYDAASIAITPAYLLVTYKYFIMKRSLHQSAFYAIMLLFAFLFFGSALKAQSCSSNNIGFNGNTATNTLTICVGTTGTTIDGANPTGNQTYNWQVSSTSVAGPFANVSPISGDVQNWTISSTYYNAAGTYYFRRVISGNGAPCDGNSDVVTLTVEALPATVTVTGGGTICVSNTTLNASNGGSGTIYYQGTTSNGTSTTTPSTSQVISTSGTYYFRARSAGGCWGTQGSAVVTFSTNSTLSFTSGGTTNAQTKCAATAITNITYTVGGGGTGATVTGLPSGVTGAYNSGTKLFTISGAPTVAGSYSYTVTTTGLCTNTSLGGTIDVIANATISLTSGVGSNIQTRCANSAITNITYAIGRTGTGAFVTGLPPGITGLYNAGNGVFSISGAATAAVSGVFNYTVTNSGPCITSATGTITINAIPTTTGVTVCQGGSGSLTSTFACATGAVVNTAATNATTGTNVTGIGNTAWLTAGNVVSDNNSDATVALTNATAVSNYLRATGYSFAIPPTATIGGIRLTIGRWSTNQSGSVRFRDNEVKLVKAGTIVGSNKANAGVDWPSAEAAFTYGTTSDLWGTTWTAADINNANFGAVLSGLNATGSGLTYTGHIDYMQITVTYSVPGSINWYTASLGGTLLGSGSPFNPVGVLNSPLANTNTPGTTTFYAECSTTPGCRTPTDFVITASSTISLTSGIGSDVQTVCVNNAITDITYAIGNGGTNANVTGLPNGVTASYNAGTLTISGTPSVAGTYIYTVTSVAPCPVSVTGTLSVSANATISLTSAPATAAQTKCINTAITNITYAIGAGGTGATVTGLPTGVTGNFNAGVFTISGAATQSGSFSYTVTTTGPCLNNSLSGTIDITQNATISLSSGAGTNVQTVCINNLVSDVTYAIGGSGTGATVTGLPAGVTGSYSAGVFTISGTPSVSGTFNYSVTATGPCANPSLGGTIIVNANVSISLTSAPATAAQTKCINTAITNITYAIGAGGTGATVTGLPTGVTGNFNAGVFTISGAATQSGSFSYTVTTTGPCLNNSLSGTIDINPNATISLSSAVGTNAQTICNSSAITPISYTLGGGATGAGVTGLPAGVTGSYNAGVFTIVGTTTALAGTYNYVVTTTGTCVQASANGSITISATMTATFATTNISACGGAFDGKIIVTPSGGTGPYTYSWSGVVGSGNPATAPYPSPGNVSAITGLNIGYYNVMINDAIGCSVTVSNIHVQYAFAAFITHNGSISSACGNTGSIILYANAGVLPYTFSLDGNNFLSNNTFLNLAAGQYTAYVKDGAGCVITKTIQINAAAPVVVNPFARGTSSCANDGSIEIYRTGGISPFTYSINGVNYQVSNKFLNLAAGLYTTYVKDSKGCIGSQTITVTQGTALTVSASKTNASTCTNDGSISVIPSGGVAPYTYSINGGLYQSSNSFSGLAASTYAISVKDFKGCLGSINVTINLNPINVTSFVVNAGSCAATNGSIQLFRTGGVGPYTYSLDGNTYQSSTIFTGLAPGTYDGFVKGSKACVGALFSIVVGPVCAPPPFTRGSNTMTNSVANTNTVKVSANSVLKLNAYPNPSAAAFTLLLEGNSKEKVTITVTDLMGRKIYQTAGNVAQQYKFGNDFKVGMYLLQVVQGNDKQNIKLIKE